MATFAPSWANRMAMACPMPDDAPVINAVLPSSLFIIASFWKVKTKARAIIPDSQGRYAPSGRGYSGRSLSEVGVRDPHFRRAFEEGEERCAWRIAKLALEPVTETITKRSNDSS